MHKLSPCFAFPSTFLSYIIGKKNGFIRLVEIIRLRLSKKILSVDDSFCRTVRSNRASLVAQEVKNLPAMQENQV